MFNIQKFKQYKIAYFLFNYIILGGIMTKRFTVEQYTNQPINPINIETQNQSEESFYFETEETQDNIIPRYNREQIIYIQYYIENNLSWREILCPQRQLNCKKEFLFIISMAITTGLLLFLFYGICTAEQLQLN